MPMTKKNPGEGAHTVKFALNANPREQQVQEKKKEKLREKLPHAGDAVLGKCIAAARRERSER